MAHDAKWVSRWTYPKWDPYLTPSTHPMPGGLTAKHKRQTAKLLEEIWKHLPDSGKGRFLKLNTKSTHTNTFDYTKIKNFWSSEGTGKREVRQVKRRQFLVTSQLTKVHVQNSYRISTD